MHVLFETGGFGVGRGGEKSNTSPPFYLHFAHFDPERPPLPVLLGQLALKECDELGPLPLPLPALV